MFLRPIKAKEHHTWFFDENSDYKPLTKHPENFNYFFLILLFFSENFN